MTVAAPGWYPDARNTSFVRWWDGTQWTDHVQPVQHPAAQRPAAQQSVTQQQKPPSRKRDLRAEVERLQQTVDSMGIPQLEAVQAETRRLQDELPQLQKEHSQLLADLGPMRAEAAQLSQQHVQAASLHEEIQRLQAQRDGLLAAVRDTERLTANISRLGAEYAELSSTLVETRETALLQEAGVYEYRHPLDDSVAYKATLTGIKARIKDAVKAGNAVVGSTTWTVNNSAREGTKMVGACQTE